MDEGLIARRYALAMLKVAQKYNAAEEVYQKMKTFEQNYISHPDLHKALLNPILSPRDKEQLLTIAIGIEPGTLYLRGIRLLIKKSPRDVYPLYLSDVPEVIPEGVPDRTNKDYHGGCFEAGDAGPDKKTGDGPDFQTDRICRKGRSGYYRGLCTPGKFHAARLFSRRRVEKNRKAIEIGEDKYK